MSSRRPQSDTASIDATKLRMELAQFKQAHIASEAAGKMTNDISLSGPPSPHSVECTPTPSFEQLSGVEKAAGSLGVHPDSWKPIKFMNNAHYDQLMKANAIDDSLARRIEAFRHVAAAQ